jgi:ubiquinone/menaquinone biosynthesis C-methylase UbiE
MSEQKSLRGWLDTPTPNEVIDGVYLISGWVLDIVEIKRVQICLDDLIEFNAFYGDPRAGVSDSYPSFKNPNCGFSFQLDTRKIQSGRHNLKIIVTNIVEQKNILSDINFFIRELVEPSLTSLKQLKTLQALYRKPVYNISKIYRKLYTVINDPGIIQNFIHDFETDPEGYDSKYYHLLSTGDLLKNAFSEVKKHVELEKPNRILDIGCAGGDITLALMGMFPDAQIISGDLSIGLLALLRDRVEEFMPNANSLIIQINAEELDFQPRSMDLVIGKAILHHLFHPEKTIKCCSEILKPGACAIFFEPFENGNSLMSLMMDYIFEDIRSNDLPPKVKSFFVNWVKDMANRKGRDKTHPMFCKMDDKWLFTKSMLNEWAALAGFSKCIIYSLHDPQNMFQQQMINLIKIGVDIEPNQVPDWIRESIAKYESYFSDDLKQDLLIEGCIIFIK